MAIPWIKLIRHAPTVLSLSRDVLQATRQKTPVDAGGTEGHLRKLEADLDRQAEVIHALAGQVEGLTAAAAALRRLVMLAISLGIFAFLLSAAALAVILTQG